MDTLNALISSCMSWLIAFVLIVGLVPGEADILQLMYIILYFYSNLILPLHDSATVFYS